MGLLVPLIVDEAGILGVSHPRYKTLSVTLEHGEGDVCLNYVGISPKRKGRCSTATVGISLSDETKVIELVGEPRNTT